MLRRLGEWDEAIDAFRALVDREPSNPNYVVSLLELLEWTRRYAEVQSMIHTFERRAPPDYVVAFHRAFVGEATARDPEVLRRYLDTWRDRLDPDTSWFLEQAYLRHSGRTEELASHLVAAREDFNTGNSGLLMPVAGLRGYGRLLQGARSAPEEAHDLSAAAARMGRLPSREWNIVLLEAQAALFSGDRKRAVDQAKRALALMTVERDALLGPQNMAEQPRCSRGRAKARQRCRFYGA